MIVIITIFIEVILLGLEIQYCFIQQDINKVKARYAAEAGIASFLSTNLLLTRNEPHSADLSFFKKSRILIKPTVLSIQPHFRLISVIIR